MKRIVRDRQLAPEEAARYKQVRDQVSAELPDLVQRHHQRMEASEKLLKGVLEELKAAREQKGLSLTDMTDLTGMDTTALSNLESGQKPNPSFETLARYAGAVGKRLVVALIEA